MTDCSFSGGPQWAARIGLLFGRSVSLAAALLTPTVAFAQLVSAAGTPGTSFTTPTGAGCFESAIGG